MPRSLTLKPAALATVVALVTVAALASPAAAGASRASGSSCRTWAGDRPPVPGSGDLDGVAVLSACDIWTVGGDQRDNTAHDAILRWTTAGWKSYPSSGDGLNAVAATGPASAWAVGASSSQKLLGTLTEHWNGKTWKAVPSPDPSSTFNVLLGVAATSAGNVWAAGYVGGFGAGLRTLVLRWNGRKWLRQATPNPAGSTGSSDLTSVAATSRSSAWAVGAFSNKRDNNQPLTVRWTGSAWKQVTSPDPGGATAQDALDGVAATSKSDAWAVGQAVRPGRHLTTLILHWNGTAWRAVASPDPGGAARDNALTAVAVVSARDAWAVGYYRNASHDQTLVLHWNGAAWQRVSSPDVSGADNDLFGVDATSAGAWLVGSVSPPEGASHALALRCTARGCQ
jgi:hypothetical protein